MPALSVHLLGTFHIDATPTPAIDTGKAQELFCYLLLHRDRPIHRDLLAGALWGGNPNDLARKYLRQALWQLQSSLAPLTASNRHPWLQVESGWIQLDSGDGLWLDVSVVEDALAATRGVPGRELSDCQADLLRAAVTLYRGDLLEGWYQDWCLEHREAMQASCLDMLGKLASYSEGHGRFEEGITFARRALHIDPAHERTHRQLMWLYHASGDRTRALRQYARCVVALRDELGIGPARRTTELYEWLRQEDPGATPGIDDPTHAGANPETLADLAHLLHELQASLAAVERRLWDGLQAVEIVLMAERIHPVRGQNSTYQTPDPRHQPPPAKDGVKDAAETPGRRVTRRIANRDCTRARARTGEPTLSDTGESLHPAHPMGR